MRITILSFFLLILTTLSGCIEIIEDLTINADRSGTYKLTINLSASRMKVKSLMAMDSLRGKKVPEEAEIKNELNLLVAFLNKQKGLTEAKTEINFDDLICKVSVNFATLEDLQKGIHSYTSSKMEEPIDFFKIFELTNDSFKRNAISQLIDEDVLGKIEKEDLEQLKESSIVFITRFEKPLKESDVAYVSISKNRMAGMFRTNLLDIIEHKVADSYKLQFLNE